MVGREIAILLDLRRGSGPRKLQVGKAPLLAEHPAIADDVMLVPILVLLDALLCEVAKHIGILDDPRTILRKQVGLEIPARCAIGIDADIAHELRQFVVAGVHRLANGIGVLLVRPGRLLLQLAIDRDL